MMIEDKHLKENKSMNLNLLQHLMHLALNHKKEILKMIKINFEVIKKMQITNKNHLMK
jgi:hypothetical protein